MRQQEYTLHDIGGAVRIHSFHSLLEPQVRPYRAHHHTECEIGIFLAGSGCYTVGKRQYDFAAGDVFLFGSDEEHSITHIKTPMELLNVHFEPRLLWEDSDTAALLCLFSARSARFENRFRDPEGRLRGMLLALEEELCERRPCYAVAAKHQLFAALTHIIRAYPATAPQREVGTSAALLQGVRDAMAYIHTHLAEKITLKALGEVACLSPTYFSAVFKKLNGISPFSYITIKRVEAAIDLLQGSSLSKLEIAERCGFFSSSHFYKAFKAVTGKCPQDYVGRRTGDF